MIFSMPIRPIPIPPMRTFASLSRRFPSHKRSRKRPNQRRRFNHLSNRRPCNLRWIGPLNPLSNPLLNPLLSSLGATLIANGIVRKRNALAPDPLAPIRRLSQAEKIALFS